MSLKRVKVTKRALKSALKSTLSEQEKRISQGQAHQVTYTQAHALIMQAISLMTGQTRRHLLESVIEELGRRYGLPAPPVPCALSGQDRFTPHITSQAVKDCDKVAKAWPALWKAIEPTVSTRIRAYNTLVPKPYDVMEAIARTPRRELRPETMPVNEPWSPEAEEEEELLKGLEGLD